MSGTFTIDKQEVTFNPGDSIMQAAHRAGIYIPHLCHHPDLPSHGSCRLCIVKSKNRTFAACITPAAEGLEVENNNETIMEQRRTLLKLLFVEGNHTCPACEKSGNCQLQAVAYYCGMLAPEFTHLYPRREIDASHPDIAIDFNRCILCGLCVRASEIFDGKSVFSISGRGIGAHLSINSANGKLAESDFSTDDEAATICPVGAILPKHRGYDLPIGKRLYDNCPVDIAGDTNRRIPPHAGKPNEQ